MPKGLHQPDIGAKIKQLNYSSQNHFLCNIYCIVNTIFRRKQMKQIFSILLNPTNHSYLNRLGQGVRHKNAKYQLLWFLGNSFQIQSIKEKCKAKYNETREVSQIASTDLCRTFKLSLISRYSIFS